jgi:glycosyltransferase involved in cell wall biosynthesis
LDSVNFILLGGGADEKRLKRLTQDLDLNNVTFIPRVASNEVSKYLYAADILFVHLKNTGLFKITIPSKILSYLNAKKPILMGLKGDAAAIIEDSGSGLLFEPENVDDLIKKIEIYLEMETEERRRMGQKGIQYYQENLSLKSSTDRLEKCFKKIAK